MRKIALILYLIIGGLPLCAQEVYTLEQCREMALKYNKEMGASKKQIEGARYMVKSYKGNFFPNISLTATGLYSTADGGYSSGSGNLPLFMPGTIPPNAGFAYFPGIDLNYKIGMSYMAGVQLEQPLYMGGKIRTAYKMAILGQEVAEANEVLTASNVILNTEKAYVKLVKAQEMKKVAEKYRAVLTELYKNIESAHRHGLKPQNDLLKVQVKLNESELSVRKAENALRLATMNLCHWVGLPLEKELQVSTQLPAIKQNEGVRAMGIHERPEFMMLSKQVDLAGQQVKLTRSELLPKIGLKGAYDYMHGLDLNGQPMFDGGAFSVLLNVSVPLYHFGERTNKVRAAKARLEQTRMEQENMNEQMRLEQAQAINVWDEANLESQLADRSLMQAEENMRVSASQYKVGMETLSDYLEAQALWQQAYETKVDAYFQLYLAYLECLKANGTLYRRTP